jgi:hypothetical protein
MLVPGHRQAYDDDIAVNREDEEKVGKGIYCSPLFTTCLFDYAQPCMRGDKTYHILLQCRFNPTALKITPQSDYWVINKSKDIRPYGMVLFTE